ncbi:MAG: insulinase family protein [Deltaproteobacteria bacterium]|nr:insulinase family protein [Deltaproteobacteria bacterium]
MITRPSWFAAALVVVAASAPQALAQVQPLTVDMSNVRSSRLENGLELITIEDHSVPIVTVEIVARAGSFVEPPELSGLSHLYEHMFFKGNATIPNQEAYLARMRELGIRFNGTTSEERVNYFFTLESSRLREGMVFMRDAIRTPLFDDAELTREREVVIGEYDRNEASPYYHLSRQVDEYLWRPFATRKNPLGDRRTILSATREQMVFFKDTYYVPNNAALVVAGDVDPARATELAHELFGDWRRAPDPFVAHPRVTFPPLRRNQVVYVDKPSRVAVLQYSWHGPDVMRDRAATYAADVFSFILGQGASAFQNALVDTGVTLQAGLSYYTQANVGPISLSAATQPEKVLQAMQAIDEQVARFDDADYFTDEQLETAKTLLAVSRLQERERTSDLAHNVSFWWACCGLDYYMGYLDGLRAVTRADIQRYVRTYVQGKPFVLGVLLDGAERQRVSLGMDEVARRVRARLVPMVPSPLPGDPVVPEPRSRARPGTARAIRWTRGGAR